MFSPTELKLLHKLDCSIENASLETKEFALYSVLGTLLGMYADSFTVFTGPDYRAFVHTTPQDTLTGHTWIQLGAGKMSLQAIPDMTVRITRLYQDQGGRDHHLVLTIEAKRLVGIHGSMYQIYNCGLPPVTVDPFLGCHSDDLKNQAVEILPKHIGQLMFQAFSAWSESCKQGQLYVGILIGPYLTVLVFNHPPSHNPNNLPSSFTLPPHTHSEGDNMDGAGSLYGEEDDLVGTEESESMDAEHDKLLYAEGQHLCDAFPPEHAPQLVIYMEHIFKEPGDWRVGLSSPLQYIFDLATINIIKGFEPDIIQEPSGIFTFEGAPQTPYNVTTAEEVGFIVLTNILEFDNLACTGCFQ